MPITLVVAESMVPPEVQTDAIADGIYFGRAQLSSGNVTMALRPLFTGTQCFTQASLVGAECLNDMFFPDFPAEYLVTLAADAFVSVDAGVLGSNLRVSPAEFVRLVNGEAPSPGAPAGYVFDPGRFLVNVVGGQAVAVQQIFLP